MRWLKNLIFRILLLAGAFGCPAAASASTVIGTLNSVGVGDTITMNAVLPNGHPLAEQVLLGMDNFTRTGGTDTSNLAGSSSGGFLAFCLEPYEEARLNSTYTYNVDLLENAGNSSIAGGIGATKAIQIAEMFGKFAPSFTAITDPIQAAALQVATWEIVGEPSTNVFDLGSGNMYFTTPSSSNFTSIMSLAQSYLNYVSSANGLGPQAAGLLSLTNNGAQDMLVQVVSAAPEPATWIMLILGFGLVGAAMRAGRRGQTARATAWKVESGV